MMPQDFIYTAESEEAVIDFFRRRERGDAVPLFGGVVPYHRLWDVELLVPEITSLRVLHYGGMGFDQTYHVIDRDTIGGTGMVITNMNSPEGQHPVRKILEEEGVTWEVGMLNPEVLHARDV
ncbi:hypothetical protein GOV07_03435 [Candidatus Woesearchaeota archaeon]|nr:hypothetical protein [Candidatus Woesearchaeota archaeon]